MKKQFKDLNLNSSFLFAAALQDPETCRIVLEIILGRKVSKVNVKSENAILLSSDVRSIRLDINARDDFNVNYDIEAQNPETGSLSKRARYYQAEMDVAELKPGEPFDKLPESYVIFICTYDPFDRGLYKYTFVERCEENGMELGDGTCKIFFNTKGQNDDEVPQELIHFLQYFEESTDEYVDKVEEKSIKKLHQRITELKKSREWEAGYMKVEELLEKQRREGMEQGLEQGLRLGKIDSIILFLSEKGSISDVILEKIESEKDLDKLNVWLKLASNVGSLEDFEKNM